MRFRGPPLVLGGVAIAAVAIAVVVLLTFPQLVGGPAASGPPASLVDEGCARRRHRSSWDPCRSARHVTGEFRPSFSFDIADQGWIANRDAPDIFGVIRDSAPRGSVQFLRVREVVPNACIAGDDDASAGPVVADPLAALEGLEHLTLQDRRPVTVGGYEGTQVDVIVADSALAACGGLVGADVPIFRAGDEVWGASPGERFRLVTVDVGDEVVTIVLSTDWTETPSVQELEDLLVVGERLLGSVRF